MRRVWHLVTGEYPPLLGGVGDYTARLAAALAGEGVEVHVWAPADERTEGGVRVHDVGAFDREGLEVLDRGLEAWLAPRTLLIQYVPHAFGRKGANLAFCRWALNRSRQMRDDVRVMFHEPFFPFGWQSPRRNALAAVNRVMAMLLLRAVSRAYVSTPAWETLLRPFAPRGLGPMTWLPIPSTIPAVDDPEAVAVLRARLRGKGDGRPIVGHFGTYGGLIAPLLEPALLAVLAPPSRTVALLLGEGGPEFAERLQAAEPDLRGRIVAPGYLSPEQVSIHLQACDVVVQPYPDGASARRTTLMAALAGGVATVTTRGRFTEDVWREGPVPMAPAADGSLLAAEILTLLDDAPRRRAAAADGRAFYERHFSMRRTLDTLLD
jgi:glycosyltransferase involved in cell wall biosynthesis